MKSTKNISDLVLVRHGQSEWNQKNLFTGWKNPSLTLKGKKEAEKTGENLKGKNIAFDIHYTSELKRAQLTGEIILSILKQESIKTIKNIALNERNYGDLSGLNKDDARKKWGEKQVHTWRRSFDEPPPGGESLKDTAERVIPYFKNVIKPNLENNNILICAHGNSLRALVMHIEEISSEEIVKLEIATGEPIFYKVKNKEIYKI
ncbi:MAG: 2,3-bisphosphoglycerate-dependent phosphoglycerate mutase [Gammaproteobacteria bacterium]|jgi:2,3-bisphosphoglycerate-dependent phosphoglycerate mutase|nr:MAG: 2,3-bisphosphoglycerate-dependent phosphoglycerate mutase [Gammaproteobacteria bacterium]|tara:strand:+ start:556 stop:1170 length:615 start_codon:yes stop_codon:yes gene_type:complete